MQVIRKRLQFRVSASHLVCGNAKYVWDIHKLLLIFALKFEMSHHFSFF